MAADYSQGRIIGVIPVHLPSVIYNDLQVQEEAD